MDFYVNKTSGTAADIQLAIGFASCVDALYRRQDKRRGDIELRNEGYRYHIITPRPLDLEQISDDFLESFQLVSPLDSQKQRDKLLKKGDADHHLDGFPYDTEIEKSRAYRELLKKLPPSLRTPEARLRKAPELQEIADMEADSRLENYQAVNHMKVAATFNDLAMRWSVLTPSQKRFHLQLLLDLFAREDNDIAATVSQWQEYAKKQQLKGNVLVTALQIINPTTGKGANRMKGGELAIGNLDSFWLLELLKFRGYMEATVPILVQDEDDRKIYVIQPRNIKLSHLQGIIKEFRAVFWSTTAIKLDIMASLRFAQVVMEQYRVKLEQMPKGKITSLATEFSVSFYKYMGSAHATMNLSTIGLPIWLSAPETPEKVEEAMALLDEHISIVRGLHNSKGEEGAEEYALLRVYRDFLSANDLHPFWQFTTAYSSYLMSSLASLQHHVRQLSYTGLEYLLMNMQDKNPEAVAIFNDVGFQHIADAIRYATVIAQYWRSQDGRSDYEVRYGLGRNLMRKAHYGKEFTAALAEFLFLYNEENALEEEKESRRKKDNPDSSSSYRFRPKTTEEDFRCVVNLTNKYGSELVGSMLVACGYSRKNNPNSAQPKDQTPATTTATK